MGAISAVVAVLDIKLVITQQRMKTTKEISLVVKYRVAVVCHIVVGQEPEADSCVEQDAGCQDGKTDDGVFKETKLKAERLERRLGDHVAWCTNQGEVSSHRCCEYQRHQQSGALKS